MKGFISLIIALLLSLSGGAFAQDPPDRSPHGVRLVGVDKNIKLEVLDWGGKGPPIIFLSGLGDTAHAFDEFALKFRGAHHVLGITRRGFGASSRPTPTPDNYSADRLGDDVLAIIAALKLDRPVLVGHSIAGEELSSVGSGHPEKIAGLVYLDAAYPYAFYNAKEGDLVLDTNDLRRSLERGLNRPTLTEYRTHLRTLMAHDLPQISKDAQTMLNRVEGQPDMPIYPTGANQIGDAVLLGEQKYISIHDVPMLAIFAQPPVCAPNCDRADAKAKKIWVTKQIDFVVAANPKARIVRLPYADHQVFESNTADVEREMNSFMRDLPK